MATTEDFSFPTSTDSYPCGMDSPPLWRLSPAASPDVFLHGKGIINKQEEERDEDHHKGLKLSNKAVAEDHDDEEEKMDMLWEDFNEELPGSRSSSKSSVQSGCNQANKLSKNNGALYSPSPRRAAGVLVFMRVLRKLFLLHNSHHRSVKHPSRTWQTP